MTKHMDDEDDKAPTYYNVEKYLKEREKAKAKSNSNLPHVFRSIKEFLETFEGLVTLLLGFPMMILIPFGLLFIGLIFGALAFYAALAATAAIGTYALEKKMGAHLQVEEFSLWKRLVFILPGFLATLAVLFILLYATGHVRT